MGHREGPGRPHRGSKAGARLLERPAAAAAQAAPAQQQALSRLQSVLAAHGRPAGARNSRPTIHPELTPVMQVVCTLGPMSRSVEVIEELLRAGMNVARFNFSHGSHDYHQVRVDHRIASRASNTGDGARCKAVVLAFVGPDGCGLARCWRRGARSPLCRALPAAAQRSSACGAKALQHVLIGSCRQPPPPAMGRRRSATAAAALCSSSSSSSSSNDTAARRASADAKPPPPPPDRQRCAGSSVPLSPRRTTSDQHHNLSPFITTSHHTTPTSHTTPRPAGDAQQPAPRDGEHAHHVRRDARHQGPRDPHGHARGRQAGAADRGPGGHDHHGLRRARQQGPHCDVVPEARGRRQAGVVDPVRRRLDRARGDLDGPRQGHRARALQEHGRARRAQERQPAGRRRRPADADRQGHRRPGAR